MKECFSLFTEQSKMFDLPVGERVPTIKDYIQSYKERLWGGAERRIFGLPANEKIELLRFYIKMFGNVFLLSDGRHLWDSLSVKEKIEICKE